MTETVYDWQRYWVPREGSFSYDSDGFLLPPAGNAEWGRYLKTDVVGFEQVLGTPCLVLLGEPGIGKSFAIKDAEKRTRAARLGAGAKILFRDLTEYTSDSRIVEDVFRSSEFQWWQQSAGELHVFLDSFDECLLRVDAVAAVLAGQISRLPTVKNLFLRVASRTAEWSSSLEEALKERWGKDSVNVLELAPLTRDQVKGAASVHLTDAQRFVDEVIASEVVSFAIKPLTLDLLLRVWKRRGGSLPPTQREIYEQGCLELCRDPEKRQTPNLRRRLSAEQRLAVASHIAAATFFCNRAAIWTAGQQAHKPDADLALSELAVGSVSIKGQRLDVTEAVIREALDTGLFTSRGRNRLGWAHQTYGEFLAARYLAQEGFNQRQSLALLTHPHDPNRKLVPQLQETAAWAATPGSDLFTHLARIQPDVLLRSDVTTADIRYKSALVEALIAAVASDTFTPDWWKMRMRYRKLLHPTLARQLRKHVVNRKLHAAARVEAITMAEACSLSQLLPTFTKLALDRHEDRSVREKAAGVLAESKNQALKKKLRPLALGKGGADPDDELRGAGLTACWPTHLSVNELFTSLKVPDESHGGSYMSFLSRHLVEGLSAADLPTALAWVSAQPEDRGSFTGSHGGLGHHIIDHAADHIEEPGVVEALADAVLSRLRKHEFTHRPVSSRLVQVLESRPDLRLKLVEAMVPLFHEARHDSLLVTQWGLRLLFPTDLDWAIQQMRVAASPQLETGFAHLVSWIFYPDDVARVSAVIEASEACPVLSEVMPVWLKPMIVDSDVSRKARELHFDEKRYREEAEERRKPKLLSPTPGEHILKLLDRFEAGEVEAWWSLCRWMEFEDNGQYCEKHRHMDLRELTGWKKAQDTTKARIITAAERYLCERGAEVEKWFSKPNIWHHPAVAGFRAMLLLANESRHSFDALPDQAWKNWLPAILRPHYYDERDAHQLLTTAGFDRAPNDAVEWTIKVLNEEDKEGDHLPVLQKLPESWSSTLQTVVLGRIKKGRLKPQCFAQLLTALLKQRVSGALEFSRSKTPRKLPANPKQRQMIASIARLLMEHGEGEDWPRVWCLIQQEADFGKALLEGLAYDWMHGPAGILRILSEAEVGALWEWMVAQYPVTDDPDRRKGGTVTARWAVAEFRDNLISYLAEIGTVAGCAELQRLITKYPQFHWFKRMLLRGQEQVRRLTWQPVAPTNLFQLAGNRHARLVQSGGQLLEVIVESLNRLQERLQGEIPLARYLWDGKKPKCEEDISDWIKVQLDDDLRQRGVVLGREVQIHRFDVTDIDVTAVTQSQSGEPFDSVKVIIEVKGSRHREVRKAMETQLVDRYLKNNDCGHGLYLVGWFPQIGGTASTAPRKLRALEGYLNTQAQTLSKRCAKAVQSLVLDFTLRQPARKGRSLSRRKRRRKS